MNRINNFSKKNIFYILLGLWICWAVLDYYSYLLSFLHDIDIPSWPINASPSLTVLAGHIKNISFISFFILTAWLSGKRILEVLRLDMTFLDDFIFSTGLGMGLLSLMVLLLGSIGLFEKKLFACAMACLFMLNLGYLKNIYGSIKKEPFINGLFSNARNKPIWFLLIFAVVLNLSGALSPETYYDSLLYHIGCPNYYFIKGKITLFPFNLYANIPANMQMLYSLMLSLSDDILAKLLHFSFGILVILAIFSFCKKYYSSKTAWWAIAIFYLAPWTATVSQRCGVELGLSFFQFLSVYSLLNSFEVKGRSHFIWIILAGFFMGIAAGIQYLSIISIISVLIAAILLMYSENLMKNIHSIVMFCVTGFIFFLPWLLKNIFLKGNPFYPYASGIFGTDLLSERFIAFINETRAFGAYDLMSFFPGPWLFNEGVSFGPILPIFLPLIFFVKHSKPGKFILTYCSIFFILWFSSTRQVRFLIPALPFFAILISNLIVSEQISRKMHNPIKFLTFIFLLTDILILILIQLFSCGWHVSSGLVSKNKFLYSDYPGLSGSYYRAAEFINSTLKPDSKILFIGEPRTFYFNRDFITASVFDRQPAVEIAMKSTGVTDMEKYMIDEDITHILINTKELRRLVSYDVLYWDVQGENRFISFIRTRARLLNNFDGVYLYEVSRPGSEGC